MATKEGRQRIRSPRKGILKRLDEGPVLGDGGYLIELEKRGYVQAGPFTPEVVLKNPAALGELHREFLDAGAEVLQSLTFYASKEKLGTVGYAGKVRDLNREAVRIARMAAGDRALVAGNISLTWLYDPKDPKSADRVRREFDEQLKVQLAEGIDFVIGETFSYLGEALVAVEAGKATRIPTMVTMCFENEPRTPEGKTPAECAKALVDAGADIVGVNCLRNPRHMLPLAIEMREAVDVPIACQPTAIRTPDDRPDFTSLPQFPYELEALTLSRRDMADYARRALAADIRFIGACCGTIPAHIREMARALGKIQQEDRSWRIDYDRPMSGYEYYKHTERPPGQGP
ncbi:MAG TPA: homocysteine S-methyltransferase family protein [Thermoplasmata archaeon]|nr:homocysteine S-methyltransferase family protein [Thermoplasmata archaeon]